MFEPSFNSTPSISSQMPRHSRLGIASLVVGILSALLFCLVIVLALGYGVSIASTNPTIQSLQNSPAVIALGLILLISPVIGLIGAVLGVVAVFQKNTKKVFSILGLILNLFVVLGFCVMSIIGLAGQSGILGL